MATVTLMTGSFGGSAVAHRSRLLAARAGGRSGRRGRCGGRRSGACRRSGLSGRRLGSIRRRSSRSRFGRRCGSRRSSGGRTALVTGGGGWRGGVVIRRSGSRRRVGRRGIRRRRTDGVDRRGAGIGRAAGSRRERRCPLGNKLGEVELHPAARIFGGGRIVENGSEAVACAG